MASARLIPPKPRRVIVIIGARSGTSALSGTFGLLGGALPKRLMKGDHSNPRGHFEPQAIADLHDRLLSEIGSAWDDWREVPAAWLSSKSAERHGFALQEAFLEDYGDAPLCVLKEPRMCRLLPLWDQIFARLQVEPLVTFMHRHPFEVARSLQTRDRSSFEQGLLYYLRNNISAELATRRHRRTVLSFDGLLADWRTSLERWQTAFGTELPDWGSGSEARVDGFLSNGLRHETGSAGDCEGADRRLMQWACSLHEYLCALERGAPPAGRYRRLSRIAAEFDRFTRLAGTDGQDRATRSYGWTDRLYAAAAWLKRVRLGYD